MTMHHVHGVAQGGTDSADVTRPLLIGAVVLITIGAFENLAVVTVLPVIARELAGFGLYALAAGLPLAMVVVAASVGGLVIDAFSYRLPLLVGVFSAAAGLALAGFAPVMWLLAVGRGVAGFGLGLITVSLYAAVGLVVPAAARPRFFAAFSAAWVVPGMVGPAVAGFLADIGAWRAVLLGVIPVLLGVIPFLLASLIPLRPLLAAHPAPRPAPLPDAPSPSPASTALRGDPVEVGGGDTAAVAPDPDTPGAAEKRAALRARARKVMPGAVGLALALGVVQAAGAGGGANYVLAAAALVVIALVLPMLLPKGTFRLRVGVPSAVAARLLISGAIIGTETYLALFLQEGRGWSPSAAGLVLTAGSISWAAGSFLQARVVGEMPRYRWALRGAGLVTGGIAITLVVLLPGMPTALTPAAWFIAGFGMGITFASLAVYSLGHAPAGEQGQISASLQVADSTGASLSIALAGAMLAVIGPTDAGFGAAFATLFAAGLLAVLATARVRPPTAATGSGPAAAGPSGNPTEPSTDL